jgi:23S rRNA pseudouridine1911/1915/1917 synthase
MIFSSPVPTNIKKNTTLLDYLSGRFTYHSSGEWADRGARGKVTVNGRAARPGETVAPGDIVAYDAGEFEEPAADLSYRIVFEDEWLLGIDKPGNLLVHRAGRSFRNNLMYQLRYVHAPSYPSAHACHRLDRGTSGVVCVAKNAKVLAALCRQFAEGKVEKIYRAVVRGTPAVREIDFPIGKTGKTGFYCGQGGKEARTDIIESRPLGRDHSLVTVRPLTGRTHQIRIHLAAVGAPVVGDRLYGGGGEVSGRHALHCTSLTFVHPATGMRRVIEAEMPVDMGELIGRLSEGKSPVGQGPHAYTR